MGPSSSRIASPPDTVSRNSLHVPEVAFRTFRAMRWHLVEAPDGSEFVTSDAPVNIFVPDEPSLGVEEDLMSPNAEATFPISPRMCLVGRRLRTGGDEWSTRVREVNQRQARAAERFVYFRKRTGAVEKVMQRAEKAAGRSIDYDLTPVGTPAHS
jgi:hypothetical protein